MRKALLVLAGIVGVLAAAIAVILVLAMLKPDEMRVERSATIDAPPERVYALIQDFHQWGQWSPWEKLDPAMQRTHSGAESGQGAVYAWEGNDKVGQGRMEILEASPPSKVSIKLEFLKPWEGQFSDEFALAPEGNGTKVTWSMHGPNAFMSKVMQVFMDMEGMVGKDFETGLANMKAAAENQ